MRSCATCRCATASRAPLWLVLKYLLTAFDASESSDTAAAHDLLGRGLSALQELNFLAPGPAGGPGGPPGAGEQPRAAEVDASTNPAPSWFRRPCRAAEERYRLSVAFQVRPVMIVPAVLPRASLLVGMDYTTAPETSIGADGVAHRRHSVDRARGSTASSPSVSRPARP